MSQDVEVAVRMSYEYTPDGKLIIDFPMGQPKLSIRQTASMLAAGLSMLIKGCGNSDMGVSEIELLREVIDHIQTEFASAESYTNAKLNENYFKKG